MRKLFTLLAFWAGGIMLAFGQASFCIPSYSTGTGVGDSLVSFAIGGFTDATPSSTDYQDLTATFTATLVAGQVSAATIVNGPVFGENYTLWIDFNNDTIWDPSEQVFTTFVGAGATVNIPVTIPAGAPSGVKRMRLRVDFSGATATDPCNTTATWGETRDYHVNILPPPPDDAGVTAIDDFEVGCGLSNTEVISVTIENFGTNAITSVPVSYQINGGTVVTETATVNLPGAGSTVTYAFTATADFSTPNTTYDIVAWTSLPNDGLAINDTSTLTLITPPVFSTYPAAENFDNFDINGSNTGGVPIIALQNGWENSQADQGQDWSILSGPTGSTNTGPAGDHTSGSGQYLYVEDSGNENDSVILLSPCIDLTNATNPLYTFWYHSREAGGGVNPANVNEMHVDLIVNTTVIYDVIPVITDSINAWIPDTIDLNPYVGSNIVRVRFRVNNNNSNFTHDIAIDDAALENPIPADAAVIALNTPVTDCGLGASDTVNVVIKNDGTASISNVPVSFIVTGPTGSTAGPETVTGTLQPDSTIAYTFTGTADLSTPGTYTIKVYTSLSGDTNFGNDTLEVQVENIPSVAVTAAQEYFEDFESGNGGWTSGGNISTWAFGTPAKNNINGASSGQNAWVTGGLGTSPYSNNERSFVIGPCFDLSAVAKPLVSLDVWWDSEFSWDGAQLQTSIDGGATWQTVGGLGDPDNWYTDGTIDGLTPAIAPNQQGWTGGEQNFPPSSSGGWVTAKNELAGLAGEPSVLIRVVFGSDGSVNTGYDGFAFDNVRVYEAPPFDVAMLNLADPGSGCGLSDTSNITVRYAHLGSQAVDSIGFYYQINGGPVVNEVATDTVSPGDTLLYTFVTQADLSTVGQQYGIDVWLKAAGDTEVLNDSALNDTIEHYPAISSFPYVQNFDDTTWVQSPGFTPGAPVINLPDNWINSQADDPWDWAVWNGQTNSFGTGPAGDHTTGSDNYLYVEDNGYINGNGFDSVILISPCFDATGLNSPRVRFWYHSNNANQPNNENLLHIDIESSGTVEYDVIQPLGHKGPNWNEVILDLPNYVGQVFSVRFRVNSNNGLFVGSHDIAIDDFEVVDVIPQDAGAVDILNPVTGCGLSATDSIQATVFNLGTDSIKGGFNVGYSVTGPNTASGQTAINDTIEPGSAVLVTFLNLDFSTPGSYIVKVWSQDLTGDTNVFNDTATVEVISVPLVATYPYTEDFESGQGGWRVDAVNSQSSTWEFGTPAKNVIIGANSGSNAWAVGGLGASGYNNNENSQVIGPCFDFTNLTSPKIELAVWWNSEFSWDGTVLQSSIDNGVSWQNVGTFGDPDNWYTDNTINGNPGGQQQGWTGRDATGNGSGGWVIAKNDLTGLGGQSNVLLRVAFGSDGSVPDDGFAFDDILIFDTPNDDVGVLAFTSPDNIGCSDDSTVVEVQIINAGLQVQSNVPVTVQVTGAATTTLNATLAGPIQPGDTLPLVVGFLNTNPTGGIFNLKGYTSLAGDGLALNDTSVLVADISETAANPLVTEDSVCASDSAQFTLSASGSASSFIWYDAPVGGNEVFSGGSFTTPFLTQTTTYYVEAANIANFNVGKPDNSGGGGNYSFFGDGLTFDVLTPMVINTVRVYPAGPGDIGVRLLDASGTALQSITVPFGGTVTDTVISVNLTIATPGSYQLDATGTTTGGLFRNNGGAVFPYSAPGICNITGTINGLGTSGFYYFFYDWTIASFGCPSDRVPVEAKFLPPVNVDLGGDKVDCAGLILDATDPNVVSYEWNGDPTINTPTITVTQSGQYYVNVVDVNGCTGGDTVNITVLPSPTVDLGPDTTECGSFVLDAGNAGAVFGWSTGATTQTITVTQSGQYFVTVDQSGCQASDTIDVTILPAPAVDLGPDLASCDDVILDAGNPGSSFVWSTGATSQTITVTPPTTGSTTITVDVTSANGCTESDTVIISAGNEPTVDLGGDQTECDQIVLDAGNAGSNYLWSTGATSQTITVDQSGTYSVVVTDPTGCEGGDTVNITILEVPVADFTFTNPGFGFTFDFTDLSTGGGAYSWDFGDGSAPSNDPNPTHTYQVPGTYTVTLTVTNACGSDSKTITLSGVGIEDDLFAASVRVYPNPSSGRFSIEMTESAVNNLLIEVLNAAGKTVYKSEVGKVATGHVEPIDLRSHAEGVYMIRLTDGEREMTKRMMLRR